MSTIPGTVEWMICCFLPLSWLFAPNGTEHKEMFVFSNSLLCIDWGFRPLLSLGILIARFPERKWFSFLLVFNSSWSIFPLGVGGRALTLRWNWTGAVCWLLFYKWLVLLQLQLTQERRGEEEASPASPLICLLPCWAAAQRGENLTHLGAASKPAADPAPALCGE